MALWAAAKPCSSSRSPSITKSADKASASPNPPLIPKTATNYSLVLAPSAKSDNLFKIIKQDYKDVDCILIDEAQFLTPDQADQLNEVAMLLNIPVIAYGLRLNFRQSDGGFEGATRLLQIAHIIEEIKTICDCGHKATRQARFLNDIIVTNGPDILIDDGSSEIIYKALCPKCYYDLTHPQKTKK